MEQQAQAVPPATPAGTGTGASLYVGDLDPNVSEAALFEHFQPVGAIVSVRICRDAITRRSLGYGYVNFVNAKDSEKAIETRNCTKLNGRAIRVMPVLRDPAARKNAAGNIFIKNIDPSLDTQGLHDMFLAMGNILSCKVVADETGKSKGYGFVHFANEKDAQTAIAAFNGKSLKDLQLFVAPFVRRNLRIQTMLANFTNVYIKNIQPNITDADIKKFFEQFGAITSTCTRKDKSGRPFAFCNFASHEQAVKAIENAHDKRIEGVADGALGLYVQRAQKKSERMFELQSRYEQSRYGGLGSTGNNLYIKNFGDFDSAALRDLFREYGDISSVYVARDEGGLSRGYGFVCFTSAEAASKALREMNGRILANRPLYVNVAQKKDARQNMLQMQFQRRPGGMFGLATMGSVHPQWMSMMAPWLARGGQGSSVPYFRPPAGQFQRRMGRATGGGRGRGPVNRRDQPQQIPVATTSTATAAPPTPVPVSTPAAVPMTPSLGPLTVEDLMKMAPDEQQAALGERLYAFVNESHPTEAPKITGMLLEMDPSELLGLINNPQELRERVKEALDVLMQYEKEAGAK
jgi:polyadenylate-binding protein